MKNIRNRLKKKREAINLQRKLEKQKEEGNLKRRQKKRNNLNIPFFLIK